MAVAWVNWFLVALLVKCLQSRFHEDKNQERYLLNSGSGQHWTGVHTQILNEKQPRAEAMSFGGRKTWVRIPVLQPLTCVLVAGHWPLLMLSFPSSQAVVKSQWGDSQEALAEILVAQRPSLVAIFISVLSIISL